MSDLECREFVERVTAFLDGTLSAEAEQDFVDHLALCDGCERYLDQIRQTSQALHDLPGEGLPGDARSALLNAFRSGRS
ncbi:zf-HC2 domain-containing protein [Kribbella capetownensis]|uniref:Zf-HC2 domain-containing protein n=1 Tax=Kribbella capetownensis TaxID=1572659 RepID=A0A4R0JL98_9ACTN|nr:zf-HC2 domain-containing protein [Kribbella capetownensis]TCC47409.1 zf-HC2 domain-containing protein [Kribbella capetownensis]